ncbi:unnamed protein product, partial [Linum tenue]
MLHAVYHVGDLDRTIHSDYGVTSYYIGTGFGHFAIATEDISIGNLNHRPFQEVVLIQ